MVTKKLTSIKTSTKRQRRSESGFGLIEILVSLIIGSIVMLAMADMLTKTMRIGSTTQNESAANAIASELLENLRQSRYDYLSQHTGTYNLLVNDDSLSANNATQIRDTPLLFDFVTKVWHPKTVSAGFKGTAQIQIIPSTTITDALKVTVTIGWTDGVFSAQNTSGTVTAGRILTTTTLVTQDGTNDYTL